MYTILFLLLQFTIALGRGEWEGLTSRLNGYIVNRHKPDPLNHYFLLIFGEFDESPQNVLCLFC